MFDVGNEENTTFNGELMLDISECHEENVYEIVYMYFCLDVFMGHKNE